MEKLGVGGIYGGELRGTGGEHYEGKRGTSLHSCTVQTVNMPTHLGPYPD